MYSFGVRSAFQSQDSILSSTLSLSPSLGESGGGGESLERTWQNLLFAREGEWAWVSELRKQGRERESMLYIVQWRASELCFASFHNYRSLPLQSSFQIKICFSCLDVAEWQIFMAGAKQFTTEVIILTRRAIKTWCSYCNIILKTTLSFN